jgi:hypothetical protein
MISFMKKNSARTAPFTLAIMFLLAVLPVSATHVASLGAQGGGPLVNGSSVTTSTAANLNAAVLPPSFYPASTTGANSNGTYVLTFYNGTSVTVNPGNPSPDNPLYSSRPYVGGWMTANGCQPNNYCKGTAAQAAISFPNTSPSVIPSGNFLEGTINLQGESTQLGIDFAIRAAHVLYPNGNHGVVADMWETCEGLPFGCSSGGLPYANELFASITVITGLSASQVIYVMIMVAGTTIDWFYSYNGNTWTNYYTFTPPSIFTGYLYYGTNTILAPPYFTAYYYQFGVWSQSAYSGTFNVEFQNPSYFINSWTTIPTAETIWGEHSFLDQTWTYSGTHNNWNINANYPNPGPTVTFYDSTSIIAENVKLW